MFYTYTLYSVKYDRYYIGHCEDVAVRLIRHNNKGVPSTKPYIPWQLVYYEAYATRTEASNRELEIKNKRAESILNF